MKKIAQSIKKYFKDLITTGEGVDVFLGIILLIPILITLLTGGDFGWFMP